MGRVFITQQPTPNKSNWTPNLEPALRYGAIHFVFGGGDRPYTDPDGAFEHATETLKDFDPNEDYLLWPSAGDPAATWAVMLAISRIASKVRVLYWERSIKDGIRSTTEGFYTPLTFNLF
jgi:hypothetical protein